MQNQLTKTPMKTYQTGKHLLKALGTALITALLAGTALQSQAGVALRLGYGYLNHDVPGTAVSALTSNTAFPNAPDEWDVLATNLMLFPFNISWDYGSMVEGFIEAPQTGQYTFWLEAIDTGELWLSTSEDPAGKVLIAVNGNMYGQGISQGPNDWFISPSQQSAPVSLVQGQKYYFELLQKEDSLPTEDSGAVAWLLPDGTFQGPISSTNLWPFPVDMSSPPAYVHQSKAPQVLASYAGISVDTLSSTTFVSDGGTAELTVTVEASQSATVQWYSNNVAIPNANLLTYHIAKATPAQNGAVYRVTITNALGGDSASTTLSVQPDTTAPTVVDALSLANLAGDVAVVFSKLVDPATATAAANYAISPSGKYSGGL
jgi:hypothetical protein